MKYGLRQSSTRLVVNLVIVAAAIAVVWIALRALAPSTDDLVTDAVPEARATPVSVMTLRIENAILVQRRFLGRLEAMQSADIGFEFGGTIDTISVREGDSINKGEVFASLVVDGLMVERASLQASLAGVQAQFDFAQSEERGIQRLVDRGTAQPSRLNAIQAEVDTLAARLVEVQSAVEQVNLRLQKSQLVAPFDGIIGAKGANLGETVAAGQPIVSIFESGGADFRVGLPPSLDPMDLRNPRITVNGTDYQVSLSAVRPDIDFRTNTRTAIFMVETSDPISFGLSATLTAEVLLPLTGAWVPVDAMRPSSEGYWTILEVGEDKIAQRVAVEVQHLRDDEAFVIGAFETGAQIISAGAHKVVPGQSVRVE